MFNSEWPNVWIVIYNLLCSTRSFLCRRICYHFFETSKALVTSYTNCLFLPNPNFPILMSSVKQNQKYMAAPLRLLHYKACFSDCWCNSSWCHLFHWKISPFSFTPAVITNTHGHWVPPHMRSPFEHSSRHVRFSLARLSFLMVSLGYFPSSGLKLLPPKICSLRLAGVPQFLPLKLVLDTDGGAPSISSPATWASFRTSLVQFPVSLWCQNASPTACTHPLGCQCSPADLKPSHPTASHGVVLTTPAVFLWLPTCKSFATFFLFINQVATI